MPLIFHNEGGKKFREVASELGFARRLVARGAAYADFDNDGYPDILLTTNGGPAYLLRNSPAGPGPARHAIRIKTVGTRSNRDGIGAVVRVETRNGAEWKTVIPVRATARRMSSH